MNARDAKMKQTLPDGRVVQCIDMTLVERVGDHWVIDVHLMVEDEYITKRVECDWTPPESPQP